jgi:hypothetical protein
LEDTTGASKKLSGRWHYQTAPGCIHTGSECRPHFRLAIEPGKAHDQPLSSVAPATDRSLKMNANLAVLAFTIAVLGLFSSLEIIPGVGSFAASMMLVIGGTVLACQLMIRGAP